VDIDNPTQQEARYEEAEARTSSLHGNRYAGKIRWILQHSYPQVNDLQRLAKTAGAKQLTPRTAAAGTQVAIWRYSEHPGQSVRADRAGTAARTDHSGRAAQPNAGDRVTVEAADRAAEKLADHLEKAALQAPEPGASLSLDRTSVSGQAGAPLGPVTVRTRERTVAVAPGSEAAAQWIRIVGANGKPVTTAHNGSKLYFAVPKGMRPGSASLTVQAASKLPVGRLLSGAADDVRSPAQIIAGSSWSTVSATAEAHWADKGPIPAATARKDCDRGVVDTTVRNGGDRPFTFGLAGQKHHVAAGATSTVPVPVQEDQPYRIAITGPNGYERIFSGVLDCATVSASDSVAAQPGHSGGAAPQLTRPATVGGTGEPVDSVDLAQTGSSSNTPTIIGIAIGLVVAGGAAVLMVRRRDTEPQPDGSRDNPG
jgi:TQXA domain-containing protein/LPXTG-motif cell wall-anchored protein